MAEQLMRRPEELINPQKVKLDIVDTAVPLWDETNDIAFVPEKTVLVKGITIEELAEKVPGCVYGFEVHTGIKGTVEVNGRSVEVSSRYPISEAKIVFINGKIRQDKKYIETRTGKRMPFVEGVDRNIPLKKMQKKI